MREEGYFESIVGVGGEKADPLAENDASSEQEVSCAKKFMVHESILFEPPLVNAEGDKKAHSNQKSSQDAGSRERIRVV